MIILDLSPEEINSREFELKGIELANAGKIDDALENFNKALEICPLNASALNNRAQVMRLLDRIDEAKKDLDRAIELSDQDGNINANVAQQAYCQRAMIHFLRKNENQGRFDMERSAKLGNKFARSYMAKMNPYAALCNQMLQDMFKKYKQDNY